LAESIRPLPVIPDHELLQRVGRGSYGEVWLSRNALGSLRAVKIVYRSSFDHDRPYEREFEGLKKFEPISHARESQIDVFHVGRNDQEGFFYYIMELADRAVAYPIKVNSEAPDADAYEPRTLKHELLTRGALPVAECVQLALSLARALEHLHNHGLVHRDIKPSNIIFVNGVPKLADIGLVTSVDATRSFVGTDGYIPPEGPGTPQADLYSLGKVLYECVTGKDRLDFPELPTDWRTRPDFSQLLEFNEILTKACDDEPGGRYESAGEMGKEIAFLNNGQSVKYKRAWHRRLSRMRKVMVALGTLGVISICSYTLVVWFSRSVPFSWSKINEANEEYLSGRASLHTSFNGGSEQAIEHFQRAIALDPRFAAPYVGLAQAYLSLGQPGPDPFLKAQSALQTANVLDPKMAEAHTGLAAVAVGLDLDWDQAEKEMKCALQLNPKSPDVLYECALMLAVHGQRDVSMKMLAEATRADPRAASVTRLRHAAHIYRWTRNYDQAIKKYEEVIAEAPSSRVNMEMFLAEIYLAKEDYLKAIQLERDATLLRGEKSDEVNHRYDSLEQAFKKGGPDGYWQQRLQLETSRSDQEHLMRLAAIHARLNEVDVAFGCLTNAFQRTPREFGFRINTDANFDGLRSDPRFDGLLEELWRKK
jgi:serine/threonine protein kinase